MQIIMAYVAWGTLFSLLGGLPAPPQSPKPDVKLPDQARLKSYVEHFEKKVGAAWVTRAEYDLVIQRSVMDSVEKGTGQVILLRLSGFPEVFWQVERTENRAFFRLHIGVCRFSCQHVESKDFEAALDFRAARLSSFRWKRDEKFWADNSPHLWITGSIGPYDYHLDNGEFSFGEHLPLFEEFFKRLIVAIQSRGPVGLLISLKPGQAQKRFNIKLTKDNENYAYIEAFPKDNDDRTYFSRAQLVIERNSCLPRRLWYVDDSRDAVTYNFTQLLTIPR
jgi:hypothetical protein